MRLRTGVLMGAKRTKNAMRKEANMVARVVLFCMVMKIYRPIPAGKMMVVVRVPE